VKSLRWTRAQYLEFCRRNGTTPLPIIPAEGRKKKTNTEEAFAMWFHFRHPSCGLLYEPFKLRIDGTCWYTPDYFCPELLTVFEVKGSHIFEDSVIKFKAARAMHAYFHFEAWQLKDGTWRQIWVL
jgi:hypothetical protein